MAWKSCRVLDGCSLGLKAFRTRQREDPMSRSVAFRSLRFVGPAVALVYGLAAHATPAKAAPRPAPRLTADTTYPNLFYGAVPSQGYDLPVLVFVHGLGGSFVDWIEVDNCPTSVAGCKG